MQQDLAGHIAALRRYALALTRNPQEAEDLVQDCLSRAIGAAASYRPGTNLRAWLFRILHNAHISELRRRQTRERFAEPAPEGGQAPDQLTRVELGEVLAALDRLPEPQRAAITLIALEDMRYEEAAAVLGIPLGTFMSRLARGREALRRALAGEPTAPRLRLVGGSE